MTKKKKPAVEAFDNQGPQNLPKGYTWCPTCQASFQGEVCPGCFDPFAAQAQGGEGEGQGYEGDPGTEPQAGAQSAPPPDHPAPAEAGGEVVDAEIISVGDKVELNSGGPEMTVIVIDEDDGKFLCEWDREGEKVTESFVPATIHKIIPPTTLAEVAEQASTEITTVTEILPVPLTDAEYKEIGKMQAQANQEIAQAEDELKSVKSQFKSRIDSAEARRNEFASIINAGHQQKQVECHLVKDFTENTITLIRLDTYETVRTRTMSTAEKQKGLNFED
jgi:uncharacterized protein YodC (DUF2158 family)